MSVKQQSRGPKTAQNFSTYTRELYGMLHDTVSLYVVAGFQ